MRNRNNEIERDPDAEFDYKDFEVEHGEVIEAENPYDDYEIWDVEITETVVKKIAIFARDAESAQEYAETLLDKIDMNHDIDQYEIRAEVKGDDGSSVMDYTVPLWWYQEEDEDE